MKKIFLLISLTLQISCTTQNTKQDLTPIVTRGWENKITGCQANRVFDWNKLKINYRKRIEEIKEKGILPIFDIESSYGTAPFYAKVKNKHWFDQMRELDEIVNAEGIAVIALSPEHKTNTTHVTKKSEVSNTNCMNLNMIDMEYEWFLPVTAGGNLSPVDGVGFRKKIFSEALNLKHLLIGEFFFRHYPSSDQVKSKESSAQKDYNYPIDGPEGEELFSFSSKYHIPFQIHYEVEDALIAPLEKMLLKYPEAKVIWAHFGRVRKKELSKLYGPGLIGQMIKKYPNLYFDTSCINSYGKYPPLTGSYESELIDHTDSRLKLEWKKIIEKYPWRFLSALDLGSDRTHLQRAKRDILSQRQFLNQLSAKTKEIVAYKAAWKLLFREDY